jgi:hypothetical protein
LPDQINQKNMKERRYAHPFDRQSSGPEDVRGVDRSSDAIGGYYGVGWSEYFICHKTGEKYRVYCSDGVYGGKDSLDPDDREWLQEMQSHIIHRTMTQPRGPIKISQREWVIMLWRTLNGWLDSESFEGNKSKTEGVIGTIKGVQVIVDPNYDDNLPEVGDWHVESRLKKSRPTPTGSTPSSSFSGVFAAAFQEAQQRGR